MRTRVVLLTAVSLAALSPAAALGSPAAPVAGAAAATAHPAVLPADLVTLEQRMSELQISSERFTLSQSMTGGGLPKELAALFPNGEYAHGLITLSPPAGEVTLILFGETTTIKVIGGVVYLDVPALAKRDGGRPWVKFARRDFHKYFGGELGVEGASQPGSVAVDPFAPLRARLNGALSVSELGASTVDGQPVTGFAAKLRPLVTHLTVKGTGKHLTIRSTQKLEVFIAASGVPVRTRTVAVTGHLRQTDSVDVPAINEAVVVALPAAAQMITLSELRALARKEKAEAKARAKRRAKKHAAARQDKP